MYSTGRANLPGSVVERQLHESFSRMLPELLRFSSASRLLELIPEELQKVHRTDAPATTAAAPIAAASRDLWDGWNDAHEADGLTNEFSDDDDTGIDLEAMGF